MFTFLLSVLALINSFYLSSLKFFQTDFCLIGNACGDVINSDYSMLWGIPLSVYGLLFFSVLTYIIYQRAFNNQDSVGFELALLSFGTLFSLYLMIVQFFIIKSFCIYCSFSASVTILLLVLVFLNFKERKGSFTLSKLMPTRYISIGSSIILSILLGLILYGKHIVNTYHILPTSKLAAQSSIKTFTVDEINSLAGIEYTKSLMSMQSARKQAFYDYIARYDSKSLGLSLNQYYQAFIQNDLSITDAVARKGLLQTKGKSKLVNRYLDNISDVDPQMYRSRFDSFKQTLLTYYDAKFLLDTTYKITVADNQYGKIQLGDKNAPLEIIIFSDFLCSHCAHFHKELETMYQKHPQFFNITFRNFPIQGQLSETLATLGICSANQNNYMAFADAMYHNQKSITFETIHDFIPDVIDKDALNACSTDKTVFKLLQDDIREVRRLNIQGTPTIFLNGYLSNIMGIKTELNKIIGDDSISSPANPHHSHQSGDHHH